MSGSRSTLVVNGDSLTRLQLAMRLLDTWEQANLRIVGYTTDSSRFVLFEFAHPAMTPFPAPVTTDFAAMLVMEWLRTADYDPEHHGGNLGVFLFSEPF